MPRGKKISKPPKFGYLKIGFPEANTLGTLLEVGETIKPRPGESLEEFLARLKKLPGIGDSGFEVQIDYRNGKIDYARVTMRAYETTPAAPTPAGSPIGKMSSWEESFWRLHLRSLNGIPP